MSVAEKLQTIAENQQKVYDAGVKSEQERFWDAFLSSLENKSWVTAFAGDGWTNDTFAPTRDIKPTGSAASLFLNSAIRDIEACLAKNGVKLDISQATNTSQMFAACETEVIPELDVRGVTDSRGPMYNLCTANGYLKTVRKIILKEDGTTPMHSTAFSGCSSLVNLTFEGVIGTNGLALNYSSLLSHDSLLNIIERLADYSTDTSGTTWKITLGSYNLARLTDAEKQIIKDKGWTYA